MRTALVFGSLLLSETILAQDHRTALLDMPQSEIKGLKYLHSQHGVDYYQLKDPDLYFHGAILERVLYGFQDQRLKVIEYVTPKRIIKSGCVGHESNTKMLKIMRQHYGQLVASGGITSIESVREQYNNCRKENYDCQIYIFKDTKNKLSSELQIEYTNDGYTLCSKKVNVRLMTNAEIKQSEQKNKVQDEFIKGWD